MHPPPPREQQQQIAQFSPIQNDDHRTTTPPPPPPPPALVSQHNDQPRENNNGDIEHNQQNPPVHTNTPQRMHTQPQQQQQQRDGRLLQIQATTQAKVQDASMKTSTIQPSHTVNDSSHTHLPHTFPGQDVDALDEAERMAFDFFINKDQLQSSASEENLHTSTRIERENIGGNSAMGINLHTSQKKERENSGGNSAMGGNLHTSQKKERENDGGESAMGGNLHTSKRVERDSTGSNSAISEKTIQPKKFAMPPTAAAEPTKTGRGPYRDRLDAQGVSDSRPISSTSSGARSRHGNSWVRPRSQERSSERTDRSNSRERGRSRRSYSPPDHLPRRKGSTGPRFRRDSRSSERHYRRRSRSPIIPNDRHRNTDRYNHRSSSHSRERRNDRPRFHQQKPPPYRRRHTSKEDVRSVISAHRGENNRNDRAQPTLDRARNLPISRPEEYDRRHRFHTPVKNYEEEAGPPPNAKEVDHYSLFNKERSGQRPQEHQDRQSESITIIEDSPSPTLLLQGTPQKFSIASPAGRGPKTGASRNAMWSQPVLPPKALKPAAYPSGVPTKPSINDSSPMKGSKASPASSSANKSPAKLPANLPINPQDHSKADQPLNHSAKRSRLFFSHVEIPARKSACLLISDESSDSDSVREELPTKKSKHRKRRKQSWQESSGSSSTTSSPPPPRRGSRSNRAASVQLIRGSSCESDTSQTRHRVASTIDKNGRHSPRPCEICESDCTSRCRRCLTPYHAACDETQTKNERESIMVRMSTDDWAEHRWLEIKRHNLRLRPGKPFSCITCREYPYTIEEILAMKGESVLVRFQKVSTKHAEWLPSEWVSKIVPDMLQTPAINLLPSEYQMPNIHRILAVTDRISDKVEEVSPSTVPMNWKGPGYALLKYKELPYSQSEWVVVPPFKSDSLWARFMRDYSARKRLPSELAATEMRTSKPAIKYTIQPEFIRGNTLLKHQISGLNWLLSHYNAKSTCVLADDAGMGKRVQIAICLSAIFDQLGRAPFLIIAPQSSLSNWGQIFRTWAPQFSTVVWESTDASRKVIRDHELATQGKIELKNHVVIISTEMVIRDAESLRPIRWECVVFQKEKSLMDPKSILRREFLSRWHIGWKIISSKTSMRDEASALFNLLNDLNPARFRKAEVESKPGQSMTELIHQSMHRYILRRLIEDTSLPPKIEIIVPIEMSATQRDVYTCIAKNTLGTEDPDIIASTSSKLSLVTNHPHLLQYVKETSAPVHIGPEFIRDSGKLLLLDKIMIQLHERGHRVMICSHHLAMLDILHSYLVDKQYKHLRIDQDVDSPKRKAIMDSFNAPNSSYFCLLIATAIGHELSNIPSIDTLIVYDMDADPQVDFEVSAKAYCVGQSKSVMVLKLMSIDTVESETALRTIAKHIVSRDRVEVTSHEITTEPPEIRKILELPHPPIVTNVRALLDRAQHVSVIQARIQESNSCTANIPQIWKVNQLEPIAEITLALEEEETEISQAESRPEEETYYDDISGDAGAVLPRTNSELSLASNSLDLLPPSLVKLEPGLEFVLPDLIESNKRRFKQPLAETSSASNNACLSPPARTATHCWVCLDGKMHDFRNCERRKDLPFIWARIKRIEDGEDKKRLELQLQPLPGGPLKRFNVDKEINSRLKYLHRWETEAKLNNAILAGENFLRKLDLDRNKICWLCKNRGHSYGVCPQLNRTEFLQQRLIELQNGVEFQRLSSMPGASTQLLDREMSLRKSIVRMALKCLSTLPGWRASLDTKSRKTLCWICRGKNHSYIGCLRSRDSAYIRSRLRDIDSGKEAISLSKIPGMELRERRQAEIYNRSLILQMFLRDAMTLPKNSQISSLCWICNREGHLYIGCSESKNLLGLIARGKSVVAGTERAHLQSVLGENQTMLEEEVRLRARYLEQSIIEFLPKISADHGASTNLKL